MSFLDWTGSSYSFKGLNGKTYTLSPFSLEDWGKFINWVRFKPYNDALEAGIEKSSLKELFDKCLKGKTTEETSAGVFEEFPINLSSTVVQDEIGTQAGVSKLIRLSLEILHPETKSIPFNELFTLNDSKDLHRAILILNGLISDEVKDQEKN